MKMDNVIEKLRAYISNGGRFRKGEEPGIGEPFYTDCMVNKIETGCTPGDLIQIETNEGIYKGTMLDLEGTCLILMQGRQVAPDRSNTKNFFVGDIKSVRIIKKGEPLDRSEVDPHYWIGHTDPAHAEKFWEILRLHDRELRAEDCRHFLGVYPSIAFDGAHVVAVNGGCELYWPFDNDGVSAEVYLLGRDGKEYMKAPCKVVPCLREGTYHAYNYRNEENAWLFAYLPNGSAVYEDVTLVCVWKIKASNNGTVTEKRIISMYTIGEIGSVKDEKNMYFLSMSAIPLMEYGEAIFDHTFILEELMSYDSVFLLGDRENGGISITSVKESVMDTKYAKTVGRVLSKVQMNAVTEDQVTGVLVNRADVVDGYYSSTRWLCRDMYK